MEPLFSNKLDIHILIFRFFSLLLLYHAESHSFPFNFAVPIYVPFCSPFCSDFCLNSYLLCIYAPYFFALRGWSFVNGEVLRNLFTIYMFKSMYYLHLWPTIAFPCSCEETCKYLVCKGRCRGLTCHSSLLIQS
jgi:hypothetical protein